MLLAALLLFAPIVRGGNRQVAMIVLLALGLALAAVLLARQTFGWLPFGGATTPHTTDSPAGASQPVWWWLLVGVVAASPIWLSVIQLMPIDALRWSQLAGHQGYLSALSSSGATLPGSLTLSLHPDATVTAVLSAVPLTAVFLATLHLRHSHVEKLLGLLILIGIVQGVVALFQVVQGGKSFFYFGSTTPSISGLFTNRNHLADLLAMLIPVWFYFLLRQQKDGHRSGSTDSRLTHTALRPLWLFIGFAFMVMILTTQSRGGLFSGMIVLLISSFVYMAYLGSRITMRHRLGMLVLVALFAVAALASVGIEGIGSRLKGQQLKADADVRGTYTESTYKAAAEFWPWGTGAGSYESVFPRYQEMESTGWVEYAHNDYPQLLMELGAPVLLIVGGLLVLVSYQMMRLARASRRRSGDRSSFAIPLRWFCGIGVLALLLHSRVEFNMHIPALAITATFLMGVFLRPINEAEA